MSLLRFSFPFRRNAINPLVVSALVFLGAMSSVPQPSHALIRLSCPADRTAPEAVCTAVERALADAVNEPRDIQRVARGDETPEHARAIGIALHIDTHDEHSLSGHLKWQAGQKGQRRTGPKIRLDVMDARISPQSYAHFARDLLKADAEMQDALTRLSQGSQTRP